MEWIKPYQSIGGEIVFRQKLDRGLLKFYASYTASNFDLKQDDINFPDKLRTQNKNNNLYSNLSYKGGFGDNWKIFAGISFANSQNNGIFDVYNYESAENASHLKLKLTKPFSSKIKTSFGADYFYTNFSESVTHFESGFHSNIFCSFF